MDKINSESKENINNFTTKSDKNNTKNGNIHQVNNVQDNYELHKTNEIPKDIISGQLRKLKTTGVKLFSNTNLRWVELNLKRKIFGYKTNLKDSSLKEYHTLSDFLEYSSQTSLEHKNKSKLLFMLKTKLNMICGKALLQEC
jgi:hypothetical protein